MIGMRGMSMTAYVVLPFVFAVIVAALYVYAATRKGNR